MTVLWSQILPGPEMPFLRFLKSCILGAKIPKSCLSDKEGVKL